MADNTSGDKKKTIGIVALAGSAVLVVGGLLYFFREKMFSSKSEDSEEEEKKQGSKHIWLREETKPGEKRTALTPGNAKKLVEDGFKVTVEKCKQRIFPIELYEQAGCETAEAGSWRSAPTDAIILGLKELPENDTSALSHTHIFFAHCYKGQRGWKSVVDRFAKGKGTLLDLEFLKKDNRRVAAFGAAAGMVGAAVAAINWAHQKKNPASPEPFPKCHYWETKEQMIEEVKETLGPLNPKTIIFGALGRSGRGASEILEACGVEPVKWDIEETKGGGPFEKILEFDMMFNCILLFSKIPPFLTKEMVQKSARKLSIICDVSCDNSNPNNPIPFFNVSTTLTEPVVQLEEEDQKLGNPRLDGISIDHLPTLLPKESSEGFSNDLLPYLRQLKDYSSSSVWMGAYTLFKQKVEEAKKN